MISVIIPSRNEKYLRQTVDDLLCKAEGIIEIIVVLDGYWPAPEDIIVHPSVRYIHSGKVIGMRQCVNDGISIARYDYILKCDAHCMFDKGWDKKLLADMKDDWCVVPRRKRLDPVSWAITEAHKPDVDYMRLDEKHKGRPWDEKNKDESLKSILIDDLMTFQGSCYFVKKDKFMSLGLLDAINYGGSGHEAQEICLAYWFNGGRVVVNKKTWYAHWHKDKRGFNIDSGIIEKSRGYMKKHIAEHKEEYDKLIEKFGSKNPIVSKSPHRLSGMKRRDLIKLFCRNGFKYGVEVGVRTGKFSECICQEIPGVKLLSVDPYDVVFEDVRSNRIGVNRQQQYFEEATARLSKYDCQIIRKTSLEAVREIPYESLDFVYIDGSHEFDYVMTDLIEWSKRVKKGGIVSGHDYFVFRDAAVVQAVDTYTKEHGIKDWFITDERTPSFWWVKA